MPCSPDHRDAAVPVRPAVDRIVWARNLYTRGVFHCLPFLLLTLHIGVGAEFIQYQGSVSLNIARWATQPCTEKSDSHRRRRPARPLPRAQQLNACNVCINDAAVSVEAQRTARVARPKTRRDSGGPGTATARGTPTRDRCGWPCAREYVPAELELCPPRALPSPRPTVRLRTK